MAPPRQRRPDQDPSSFSDLDRPDIPDGDVSESDTAWSLWEEANRPPDTNFAVTQPASIPMPLTGGDPRYAPTVPQPLDGAGGPSSQKPSGRGVTVAQALNLARRNNRVCPMPEPWLKLYAMLPDKQQVGRDWRPQAPLTGGAWTATPAITKRMCLRDHIEWADAHNALDEVYAFLKDLPDTDWLHVE